MLHREEVTLGVSTETHSCANLPQLALLQHLPAVAQFLTLLFTHFNMKINRVDAETALSLKTAIRWLAETDAAAARQISAVYPAFEKAFCETWPHVHRHPLNPCVDYNDLASPAGAF